MAKLEITDKDIATVEQLHDNLWEKNDMPASLQVLSRKLIARMYESIREEQEEEEHNKPF